MCFKRKEIKPIEIQLDVSEWCRCERYYSAKMKPKQYIQADGRRHYTFLSQDGRFAGQPAPLGGKIYPFSPNPTEMATRREMKQYVFAEVVVVKKNFKMKIDWGTPPHRLFHIEDPITKVPYKVGANGSFEVQIDATDAARNANQFFLELLSETSDYNAESMKNRLQDRYLQEIGAGIETVIINEKRSLENYVGIGPSDLKRVNDLLYPYIKDLFASYGLTISATTLNGLTVVPA